MIELAATAVAFLDARLLELCGRTESEYKWHVLYQVRHYYQVAQVQDFEQIAENNTCNINGVVRTSLCYARSFSICSASPLRLPSLNV